MKIHSNRLMMIHSYQQTSTKPMDNQKTLKTQSADQLEISPQAQEILKQSIENQAVESAKIQELKDRIANGTYQADSKRIADKLFSIWNKGSHQ